MKESKLIEMRNQIDTLGRIATKLVQDYQRLSMIVMGDHEVIKRLGEFPEIIKQLEDEQGKSKDGDLLSGSGATTEDSGATDTNE